MSPSNIADPVPSPPRYICDECGHLLVSEESFFQCSSSREYSLCRKCALAKTDLKDRHDFRPCFIDQRDSRPTFLPEPSLESFQLQVFWARNDPSFKFSLESKKFFVRGNVDGIPTERLIDPDSYESPRDTDKMTTKKVRNDYSYYKRLNRDKREIRVAALLGTTDSDEVGIVVGKLSHPWNRVEYVPLSYCWGSLDETRNILLAHTSLDFSHPDTKSGDLQSFECTANLDIALRAISRGFKFRFLWVDALCINQGDPKERAYQIGMMAEIYASGSRLGIWLGLSKEELEGAYCIKRLAIWGRKIRQEAATRGLEHPNNRDIGHLILSGQMRNPNYSAPNQRQFRQTINNFFSNPWFTRAWVLQEVWASLRPDQGSFLCFNGRTLLWSEVLIAESYLFWSYFFQGGPGDELPRLWRSILPDGTKGEPQRSRLPILELFGPVLFDFGASDARDKLFALFAMGQETYDISNLPPLVTPSYTKSVATVFTDFTRWHLQQSSSLTALSYATNCSRKVEQGAKFHQVPSWALSPWPKVPVSNSKIGDIMSFRTSADLPLDQELFTQIKHHHSLLLRGYRLGSIQAVSDWCFKLIHHSGTADVMKYFEGDERDSVNPNESRVLETIVADAYTRAKGELGECSLLLHGEDAAQQEPICTGQREFDRLLMCITLNGARDVRGDGGNRSDTCQDRWMKPHEIYPLFADYWREKIASTLPSWDLADYFCPHMRELLLPMLLPSEVGGADSSCCSGSDDDHTSFVSALPAPYRSRELIVYGLIRMLYFILCRGFMQLPDGKIGLSPMGARAGDVIVALFGGRTPFVLRPQLDDGGKETGCWEFIGDCFVAEFVDGKAVEQLRDSGQESEIFDLR